jgi:hypothetical protein
MIRTTNPPPQTAAEREALRRELLRLIVKNEARRRGERDSASK